MKHIFLSCIMLLLLGCIESRGDSSLALARLYLAQTNDEGIIPPQQFDEFIDAEVMPNYPHGVTLMPANGGWTQLDRSSVRGRIVVLDLVFVNDEVGRAGVAKVLAKYKERFRTPAALLVIDHPSISHP